MKMMMRREIAVGVFVLLVAGLAAEGAGAGSAIDAFLRDCREKAAAAAEAGTMVVAGKNGWLFFAGDLRHLAAGPFWDGENEKDPLSSILDYNEQLKALGIELVLLPIPTKAVVYADELSERAPVAEGRPVRTDLVVQQFYAALREKGVTVLDMTDPFLRARRDDPKLGPVYCKQDSHWSGRACELTAKTLAGMIAKRPWYESHPRGTFETKTRAVEIEGELWKQLPSPRPPRETLPLRKVSASGGTPLQPDPSSPIILLGDSHTLVFSVGGDMMATGSGLLEQIAAETGIVPDLIGVRGSGATPARINLYRKVAGDPAYLRGKKMVIWCFSAREFTETGWRKVPVTRR